MMSLFTIALIILSPGLLIGAFCFLLTGADHREMRRLKSRVESLEAALQDIHTTAHCIALAGPSTTPELKDAWPKFMEISAKATNALSTRK